MRPQLLPQQRQHSAMVSTRRAAAERARAAAMALSKLSDDEQGIILGQLRNTLEPRLVMYFSSASKELRALLPPAAQQQLRTDYEAATGHGFVQRERSAGLSMLVLYKFCAHVGVCLCGCVCLCDQKHTGRTGGLRVV